MQVFQKVIIISLMKNDGLSWQNAINTDPLRLTKHLNELKVIPNLAKSWTVSPNGLEWTFHLREDVRWFDGLPFSADDVVFTFNDLIYNPQIPSPSKDVLTIGGKPLKVEKIDEHTVRFTLPVKFAPFLRSMAQTIMPKHCLFQAVKQNKFSFTWGIDTPPSQLIGTGPFMFKTWREGEKLVFVRNPNYFEKDAAGKSLPYLDAVSITFINDKQSEFLEFVKGNLDYIWGVQTSFRNELLTRSGGLNPKYTERFNMEVMPYLNTEYLGCMIDSSKLPHNPLLNKKVRLAINDGFDRSKMLKYLRNNQGTPALWGIIPKGLPGFSNQGRSYTFNPDLARHLLAEAGFTDGKSLPEITLTTISDYLDLCEFIQHELSQV